LKSLTLQSGMQSQNGEALVEKEGEAKTKPSLNAWCHSKPQVDGVSQEDEVENQ
jgi:hypothetical protein